MAQLKDTVVQGSLRVTDTAYTTKLQAQILQVPTASNGTTYGPGTDGQILRTNGTSVYWGTAPSTGVTSITIKTTSPITGGSDTATTSTGTYTIAHASGDGNLHVPATGTGNNGKVLKAGSTAGSLSWGTLGASDVGLGNVTNDAQVKASLGTAKGDMVYWSAASTPARLAIGTAGYTLQATANGPAWTQTVAVANGGTGATSFTANSLIMSGSTTTAALTTRAITDRTSVGALTNVATWANSTNIPTVNLIAYWDGRYQTTSNSSNLTYCKKGAFGDMAIKTKGNGFSDSSNTISVAYGTAANTAVQGNANLVKLNGTNKTAASIADFYAPTSAGTSGYYLKSNGSGAPSWEDPDVLTAPLISLVVTVSITASATTAAIGTVLDSRIVDTMVVLHYELTDPAAQTSDWSIVTTAGKVQVNGTSGSATTLKLTLGRSIT